MSDILVLNAGSSSLKFALFEEDSGERLVVSKGEIEGIGTAPHFHAFDSAGRLLAERRWPAGATFGHETFLTELFFWIESHRGQSELI